MYVNINELKKSQTEKNVNYLLRVFNILTTSSCLNVFKNVVGHML